MSRETGPDAPDLTESGELVSAMSAAVGRLRQQAAAAFDAGRGETTPADAAAAHIVVRNASTGSMDAARADG